MDDRVYCSIIICKDAGVKLNCCEKSACKKCLQHWINQSSTCPYCRTEIVVP